MSNSKSKNKRLFSKSEETLRLDMISDDDDDVKDDKEKKVKALLPPKQKKKGDAMSQKQNEGELIIGCIFWNKWKMVSIGLSACIVKTKLFLVMLMLMVLKM